MSKSLINKKPATKPQNQQPPLTQISSTTATSNSRVQALESAQQKGSNDKLIIKICREPDKPSLDAYPDFYIGYEIIKELSEVSTTQKREKRESRLRRNKITQAALKLSPNTRTSSTLSNKQVNSQQPQPKEPTVLTKQVQFREEPQILTTPQNEVLEVGIQIKKPLIQHKIDYVKSEVEVENQTAPLPQVVIIDASQLQQQSTEQKSERFTNQLTSSETTQIKVEKPKNNKNKTLNKKTSTLPMHLVKQKEIIVDNKQKAMIETIQNPEPSIPVPKSDSQAVHTGRPQDRTLAPLRTTLVDFRQQNPQNPISPKKLMLQTQLLSPKQEGGVIKNLKQKQTYSKQTSLNKIQFNQNHLLNEPIIGTPLQLPNSEAIKIPAENKLNQRQSGTQSNRLSNGLQNLSKAQNPLVQIGIRDMGRDTRVNKLANAHVSQDFILKGKEALKTPKMPQVVQVRQSMDQMQKPNLIEIISQHNSSVPRNQLKKMNEKSKAQLQQHVVNQLQPWLMPQQSPQGQGGSQDPQVQEEFKSAAHIQQRLGTALPNIKQKQSHQVSASVDFSTNRLSRRKQNRRSNLRIIAEEPKDTFIDSSSLGDTFYPEHLRSAKNRISKLLKQKKILAMEAVQQQSLLNMNSFETQDVTLSNSSQPLIARGLTNLQEVEQVKNQKQVDNYMRNNRANPASTRRVDNSLDNKYKTSGDFKFYQIDSSYLEISEEKKLQLARAAQLRTNSNQHFVGPNLNIIGPDSSQQISKKNLSNVLASTHFPLTSQQPTTQRRKKQNHHLLSKLEFKGGNQQQVNGSNDTKQSFLRSNKYHKNCNNQNLTDSLRETLTKIYFNNNQSNYFDGKHNSSVNASQSPPKKAGYNSNQNQVRVSKNYQFQNQQQLAESVIIYATPLRVRKRNKLAQLLRAQKLYHGKDGKWLAQLAGIKRRTRLQHSVNSRDFLKDIVSTLSYALRKPSAAYRRYRTQHFDKNQTSTIGHDTILSTSIHRDQSIIKEESGFNSKQNLSVRKPRHQRSTFYGQPSQAQKSHLKYSHFNLTQSGDFGVDMFMNDLKQQTKSIERVSTNQRQILHPNNLARSLSPYRGGNATDGFSADSYSVGIINDSLYQYTPAATGRINHHVVQQFDLSEDETVIIR